jgi:carboxyl-terminal processing protease
VLQLERTRAGGPFTVRAFRRSVDTPLAEGQVLESKPGEPKIGFLKIWEFKELVPDRVARFLIEGGQAGVQGWVIDLRHNPGGDLQAVAKVAGLFMDQRPIGIAVDRSGQRQAIFAEPRSTLLKVRPKLVVLVDGGSGSGAELLAAALKEYQMASLVGQRTAGSVGIANAAQLADGSTVQLTVRRLLSPSGAQLDHVGVEPDEALAMTADDLEAGRDPQRDRAIQLLRQSIAAG